MYSVLVRCYRVEAGEWGAMAGDDISNIPTRSSGDAAYAVARSILSLRPGGSVAIELLTWFLPPPLERRKDQWAQQLGEALQTLRDQKGVSLEQLQSDEAFMDAVMHASQVAMRNSAAEKREALRNAIVNSGSQPDSGDGTRQLFLNWIDELTVWHMRILKLVDDQASWFKKNKGMPPTEFDLAGSVMQMIGIAYPELRQGQEFCEVLWQDLKVRRIVEGGLMNVISGVVGSCTTAIGKHFISFVEAR